MLSLMLVFIGLFVASSAEGYGDKFAQRFPKWNNIEVRSITQTSAEVRWPLIPFVDHYKVYTIQPYNSDKTPELREFVTATQANKNEGYASIKISRLPTGEYVNVYITDIFDETLGYVPELFFTNCREGWSRCPIENQRYECRLSCRTH
ncbi:uncharacterized protein LOC120344590 [Styela clava]